MLFVVVVVVVCWYFLFQESSGQRVSVESCFRVVVDSHMAQEKGVCMHASVLVFETILLIASIISKFYHCFILVCK